MEIEELVMLSVKQNASDLHLCSKQIARWRCNGVLMEIPDTTPPPQQLLTNWLSEAQQAALVQQGQIDFALTLSSGIRLRANAFRQCGGVSLALRILPQQCPLLENLEPPGQLKELLQTDAGLLLVTGATGSGKSTTLAAMVGYINQHNQRHILTLEDPVEFQHRSAKSLIQQRQIGTDCCSFASGLRAALREDPDVLLIGELRDADSIRLALSAAETGHLVLATLHTRGAPQALERLADVFPAEEKNLVRSQLASSLLAVLAQKLMPSLDGNRVALYEFLINTPAVATLIREGKGHQLPGLLEISQQHGMQTFQQSLVQRIREGKIARQGQGNNGCPEWQSLNQQGMNRIMQL